MNILLDTHTFLWWITDAPTLSEKAREMIVDGRNTLLNILSNDCRCQMFPKDFFHSNL